MTGLKNLFASRAILTAIIGAIFSLLAAFDIINIDPEMQAGIVSVLFTIAGYFRFVATEQLTTKSTS